MECQDYRDSPPPKDARATRLKLHDPGVSCREDVVLKPEFPLPEVAPCFVNGVPCNLLRWTEDEWSRLPAELRPRNPFRGDRGNRYALEPES
jgi:hypothetical protein